MKRYLSNCRYIQIPRVFRTQSPGVCTSSWLEFNNFIIWLQIIVQSAAKPRWYSFRGNLRISICIIKLSVEFEIFTAGPRSPNIYTQAHVVRARGRGRCLLFIHCTFDSIHPSDTNVFIFVNQGSREHLWILALDTCWKFSKCPR